MNILKILNKASLVILSAIIFTSCAKKLEWIAEPLFESSQKASVQLFNGIVNSSGSNIKVNSSQLNGTTAITYGSMFPSSSFLFADPGLAAFLVEKTSSTSNQAPLSFAEPLDPAKKYSVFLYDTITSPKQKTVETNIVIPSDTSSRIRFANFIFSKTAIPAVDVYSMNKGANLFTNVQSTEVTNYIAHPSNEADIFIIRETGTMNELAKTSSSGTTPTAKRSYTLTFRGRYQTTSGTVARGLSWNVNY